MKLYKLLIPIVLLPAISIDGYGQNSKEEQIRKVEELQVRGILDENSTTIQRVYANESVVNARNNAVVDMKMAMKALRWAIFIIHPMNSKLTLSKSLKT